MTGLRGDLSSLKKFSDALRELPRVVAQKVATAAAPAITVAALQTFNAGEDAFGVPWSPSADGERVTLRESGGLAAGIHYVATGTKLRVKLGVAYAKFQLGKRPAFPRQGDPLPASYVKALTDATHAVIRAELGAT